MVAGHCVTCSDEGLAGQVLRVAADEAVVRLESGCAAGDGELTVGMALVAAQPGDWVLVHAGEAIAVLPGPPADSWP
ncbi:hydrogenase expression/formation protein (HUPF/HYPC) [Pseudofrankia inefficax]|uniref:Hydrogenase expression/formation protein (HUPF/HYPC) n=2 Tax=Pseudofrankia inefficax (strain DSM 45817 / CECT 9037 / DDB 130130 / EuI1c) TaxID=298654 RepID=E3J6G6_PSEI1|nr:hydrogenase expression/formation protein (HUPF/HYPC) [Pseudofrankia inefficax]